ncbi:DNA-processing protein DprA [Verticiella sediminum]|uniref:DNA-processing protein DprA n=1 Tax=Verticiella sediminum TaxID=1247510 RepID=UPI001FEA358F|nr:DNA-processing protein DprA [Verticiella sediminum]
MDTLIATPFRAWLRLSLTPGIGPATARRLADALGNVERLFALGRAGLEPWLGPALAARLLAPPPDVSRQEARILHWLTLSGHHAVCLDDADYPARLRHLPDAPPVLYVRGSLAALQRPALAIVGARRATPAGRETAHGFAQALAVSGWCVVSGLAAGIDAAAHEGALAAGSTGAGTVAMLGTGVDLIYPARHRGLAERVLGAGGALVSELPLGAPPKAANFPRRNRLVAGCTLGVLVVEAALRSGSLITARLAAEAGREVFAIPGSIHAPLARGCHALIRQGATLVESVDDMLNELPPLGSAPRARPGGDTLVAPSEADLPPAAARVLAALGHDPAAVDALVQRTGLAPGEVQGGLSLLELAGLAARVDGGLFQRLNRRDA